MLISSSVFNHRFGKILRRYPQAGLLWAGILANAALLGTFKYLPAFGRIFPTSGFWQHVSAIALPLGVSFWTFQAVNLLVTFLAMTLGWACFRAEGLRAAQAILSAAILPTPGLHLPVRFVLFVLGLVAASLVVQAAAARREPASPGPLSRMPMPLRFACYAAIFYLAVLRPAEAQGFIYAQF